jgi:NAD-dependent aldehyde dehydrogenases
MKVEILGETLLPEYSEIFKEIFTFHNNKPLFKILVSSRWILTKDIFPVISPIDENTVAYFSLANLDILNEAINSLRENQRELKRLPSYKRAEMLEKSSKIMEEYKKELIYTLVIEAGKPIHEAEGEVNASIERLKLVYQELGRLMDKAIAGDQAKGSEKRYAVIVREPVGIVAVITPFNYPLFTPVAKICSALISGNCVLFKPSSKTPIIASLLSKILDEAGFGKYLCFLTAGGGIIGDSIVSNPYIRAVAFTGSTEVGKRISRVAVLKKLQLELGGKAPAIILDDADLKLAANAVAAGAFRLAGQRCDAISRVLIHESIYEEFKEILLNEREKWIVGDPRDNKTKVGPLIDSRAVQKVHELVEDALSKGAKLLAGGEYFKLYYDTTILSEVNLDSRICWEETFGPVIPLIKIKNIEEAIEISNKSNFGLDACVFTKDINKAWEVAKELECGSVTINDMPRHGLGIFPFGGYKDSGIGREGIGFTLEEVTEIKSIIFNLY